MSFNQPDVSESARFLNKKDLVLQSQTFSPTASSYFNIGCGYATGYGYLKDHKQAADWFRKAAELGHSLAEYNLGVMHQYGYGVSSDLCQAKSWFRRALSHGLELEQSRLLELFEKYSDLVDIGLASDNSRTVAETLYPNINRSSYDTTSESTSAADLLKRAAQRVADAKFGFGLLGQLQRLELEVEKNTVQVSNKRRSERNDELFSDWEVKEMAEEGYTAFQYELGWMYENGYDKERYNGDEIIYREAARWYEKAAQKGHEEAQLALGKLYADKLAYGSGNDQLDIKCIRMAAEDGYEAAQFSLGQHYMGGDGAKTNFKKAIFWHHKASERNHPESLYQLGWLTEHGKGTEQDYEQAVSWYLKAAKQGDHDALIRLGKLYAENRVSLESDDRFSLKCYKAAAENEHVGAQFSLGECYFYGRGVDEDHKLAVDCFLQAAEKGHVKAQLALGRHYADELADDSGDEQLDQLEIKCIRMAAEDGHANAQCQIGKCYKNGIGVEQNHELAVEWFLKAAEQKNELARKEVFYSFDRKPLQISPEQWHTLFRKAAEQGNSFAQDRLGECFREGSCGVTKDYVEAAKWYQMAADQGNADAMYTLGRLYSLGLGVDINHEKAKSLFKEAENLGIFLAGVKLRHLQEGRDAALGNPDAQYALAKFYEGFPCPWDEEAPLAIYWLEKASENNHAEAEFDLGFYFSENYEHEKAIYWYRRAIEHGHEDRSIIEYIEEETKALEQKNGMRSDFVASPPTSSFYPETLIHTTSRGDRVRSKSELIIANLLHQAGLNCQYEADLSALGFAKGVLPDFVFVDNQTVVVWEHLGMADDPEYMGRWAKKLAWYRDNGFESRKTLFVTTEMTGMGLDIAALERVVGQVKQALKASAAKQSASVMGKQYPVAVERSISPVIEESSNEILVFIDFETSGLKPEDGCRTTEVGAVKWVNGRVTGTFTSLMNPGVWLSREIIEITKITNEMVRNAPSPADVMMQLHEFLDGAPIVAHNANFDERFLRSEFGRVGLTVPSTVLCSMKLARRVAPGLPSYSLSALSDYFNLQSNKNAHRALPDARQTAALWQALEENLLEQSGLPRISVRLMNKLQEIPVKNVSSFLRNWRED